MNQPNIQITSGDMPLYVTRGGYKQLGTSRTIQEAKAIAKDAPQWAKSFRIETIFSGKVRYEGFRFFRWIWWLRVKCA